MSATSSWVGGTQGDGRGAGFPDRADQLTGVSDPPPPPLFLSPRLLMGCFML